MVPIRKLVALFLIGFGVSIVLAAEMTRFGIAIRNDKGYSLSILVKCPTSTVVPVSAYASDTEDNLSKQQRPTVTGRNALILRVPKDWWYKIVQEGGGCTATVAAAPVGRFER